MCFDPLDNALFMGAVTSLLLAMHWVGHTYPYSDARIIALFTIAGVLALAFITVKYLQRNGPNAIIPTTLITTRSIPFAALFALCLGGAISTNIYHLPLWFQIIDGVSPIASAIRTLPLLGGLDQGVGFQQGSVICQAVLPLADIPTGTALVFSMQFLGGTIFPSAAQNRFGARLRGNLVGMPIPGVKVEEAGNIGATELRALVPAEPMGRFMNGYNDAVTQAFQVALILSCVMSLGAVGIEWRSVRGKK